jgi:hypothetical protein
MTTDFPNANEDPDTTNKTVPPYDDRKESGSVGSREESTREGVKVGGASGPVEDQDMKAADPADTARGAVASPADEQPASQSGGRDEDEGSVGPAHQPGTVRGEDVPEG